MDNGNLSLYNDYEDVKIIVSSKNDEKCNRIVNNLNNFPKVNKIKLRKSIHKIV